MSTEQQLKEENARLKAEVDALKLGSLLSAVDVLQFINLKAEVERLTVAADWKTPARKIQALEAEVERLTVAADWKTPARKIQALEAEVERLTNCKAEADRLKAEVERLRASSFVTAVPVEQYERLRLAGDTMAQQYLTAYQIDLRNGPHTPQSVVE